MPLVPPTPPSATTLGLGRCVHPPPPFSSASRGTSLPRQNGHVTNTKAYGWAVAAIHHVVWLGVGGRREEKREANGS